MLRQQPALEREEQRLQVRERQESARNQLIDTIIGSEDDYVFASTGQGSNQFHGRFAGLSMLRTVRDLCTQVAGAPQTQGDLSGKALAEAFDSNLLDLPAYNRVAQFALLPSRERVKRTVAIALDCAMNCKECIDRTQLEQQIKNLYDRDPEDYTQEDRRALGLLYALMALGRRHEPEGLNQSMEPRAEMIVLKGVTYFRAARAIVDMTDNHDLNTIRALIVMASYLASSSMMSKAYSYVCAAVASALRMGLHVSSASLRRVFTPKELTERRQVFAVLNLIDTYISTTLGMPNILRDADPTQMIPCPEEELHDMGKSFVEREPLSPISESILAAKLFRVQAKILQAYFPLATASPEEGAQQLKYEDVAQREAELHEWHATLPEPSPNTVDHRVLRSQLLLRYVYASTQISLYRPFLHHVIRDRRDANFDFRGYTFGSACIQAAMQAVWLIDTMDRHGYLHEAQWFNIYTLAFASSSLNLFVLGTKEGPTVVESRSAALKAQELLSKLAQKNVSARRCYESLAKLPEEIQAAHRHAPGTVSPRTQFMMGIGAMDPRFLDTTTSGAMSGQTASSASESSSDMPTSP